jgi:hypothetical protein
MATPTSSASWYYYSLFCGYVALMEPATSPALRGSVCGTGTVGVCVRVCCHFHLVASRCDPIIHTVSQRVFSRVNQ